ncbi:MAG: cbb3-type cytochrome c oxidase N-terminal domain-containing protein [Bacteroidota bacterium]
MDNNEEKMEFNEQFDHNLLDHEYDGIRELDNPPPFWLLSLFYISVIFAVIYGAYYFWLGMGDLQVAEYEKEVAAAQINMQNKPQADAIDENNIALFTDEENLNIGAELFATKTCVTCHGANGEGNAIGPNMADEYWIHGNTPNELFQVIKNGVPTKGMTPFKGQLTPKQMVQVLSYMLVKIQGSNPANAKEPQGDKLGLYGQQSETAEDTPTEETSIEETETAE